ncbi:sodium transporter, putative, partial [Entamoeba invadens IP1]
MADDHVPPLFNLSVSEKSSSQQNEESPLHKTHTQNETISPTTTSSQRPSQLESQTSSQVRSTHSKNGQKSKKDTDDDSQEYVTCSDSQSQTQNEDSESSAPEPTVQKRIRPVDSVKVEKERQKESRREKEMSDCSDKYYDKNEDQPSDDSKDAYGISTIFRKLLLSIYPNFVNYYIIHFSIFTAVCFLFALFCVLFDSKVSYIDALFTCVSAITGSGLTVFDLGKSHPGVQAISYILTFFGSIVLDSAYYIIVKLVRIATSRKKKPNITGIPQ